MLYFLFIALFAALTLGLASTVHAYMETPASGYDPTGTSVGFKTDHPELERQPVVGADMSFVSRYVWRGLAQNSSPAFQPKAWASKWGFTPFVWANMNLGDEPNRGKFNEVDFSLSYEKSFGGFTIKPGFVYYAFPNVDIRSTGEAYLALAYKWKGLEVSSTSYFDVREVQGGYYGSMSLAYSCQLKETYLFQAALTQGFANAKWNKYYAGVEKSTVDNLTIDLSVAVKPKSWFYVRPFFQMNFLTDNGLRKSPTVKSGNLYVVGGAVGLTY